MKTEIKHRIWCSVTFTSLLILILILPGFSADVQAAGKPGGARCKRNRDCASNQCSGLGKNRKCTALDGTLAPGARCKRNEECASGQCTGVGSNRKCTAMGGQLPAGARCRRDKECKSGECAGLGSNRNCRALPGQLPPGAGCERNKECKSGQCSGVGSNRKCTALSGHLPAGSRCKRNQECQSGQCSGVGDKRRCTAKAGQLPTGARCKRNQECKSGQCAGVGNKRKCTATQGQLPPGVSCKHNRDCRSGQCSGVGSNRKCTALTGQLPPRARCRRNEECQSGQCSGTGDNRRCTELTGNLKAGMRCKRNAECESGQCTGTGDRRKCTAPTGQLHPGASCSRNAECRSGECYGAGRKRKCTAMPGSLPPGEPCRLNKECKIGKCDRIVDLENQYCEFAGRPCRKGQTRPDFPLRSSTTTRGVFVRWLGTAGFEISVDRMRILIDPFMARPWRHFQRGKAIKWSAIANALSRRQLIQGDPTLPKHMKYYEGITRADWVFVTHGHVDHAAEVGPLLLSLAKKAKDRNQQLKVGVIGDKNLKWLLDGYELKFGLERILGAQIDQRIVPYDLGGSSWEYVPAVDPATKVRTYRLGNGVTATWYPTHHSQGAAADKGWSDRNGPPPPLPISIGSYKSHGIFNVLIKAENKKIFFMGSSNLHFGNEHRPYKDPMPEGPIDVLLLALAAWDTGYGDQRLAHFKKILDRFNPRVVIPHHYDDYFWEWREGCFVMEYANLPRFLREAPTVIRNSKKRTRIKQLDYGQSYAVR